MFETQSFKKGSFIFLEGQQELDRFYILKTGSAERCISRFFQNSKAVQQCRVLEPGDLFGVISYLAKRPRMEAVQVLEDSTVFVAKKDEFEAWIGEHTDSALKIVRYLSRQLRHYDAITASLSSKAPPELMAVRTPDHLFTLGKFYWQQKKYSHAGYAFERYLQYVAAGEQSEQAAAMLARIKASKTGMFPIEPEKRIITVASSSTSPFSWKGNRAKNCTSYSRGASASPRCTTTRRYSWMCCRWETSSGRWRSLRTRRATQTPSAPKKPG